jgi:NMD protein affecting ribosome stability and mRNA decay
MKTYACRVCGQPANSGLSFLCGKCLAERLAVLMLRRIGVPVEVVKELRPTRARVVEVKAPG